MFFEDNCSDEVIGRPKTMIMMERGHPTCISSIKVNLKENDECKELDSHDIDLLKYPNTQSILKIFECSNICIIFVEYLKLGRVVPTLIRVASMVQLYSWNNSLVTSLTLSVIIN